MLLINKSGTVINKTSTTETEICIFNETHDLF